MSIPKEQVLHIAKLSRLKLSDIETSAYQEQMGQILTYVQQLDRLNTDSVEPSSHILNLENVVRSDQVDLKLSVEDVFMNAPDTEDDFFRVPQILSQET